MSTSAQRERADFGGEPLADGVRVQGIAKAFGPVRAIRECTLEIAPGQVHVLMGENGSGKSTLVKILSGVQRPDSGTITIDGVETTGFANPAAARGAGIITVFQEVLTADARSVLENVWLGVEGLLTGQVPRDRKRVLASERLNRLLGYVPDLDTPIGALSLSERQACVIARALVSRPRLLILDESTSALDIAVRDRLLEIVGELTQTGVSVLFISHRMDEVEIVGDRITVLRTGATTAEFRRGEWTPAELVQHMSGLAAVDARNRETRLKGSAADAAEAVRVTGLSLAEGSAPFDATLRRGEVVGLAGLDGQGQEDFLLTLAGHRAPYAGTVERFGKQRREIDTALTARRAGIVYLPRDRRADAIFGWMPIHDNFAVATLEQDRRSGFVNAKRATKRLEKWRDALSIKYGDAGDAITTLSGGNQQKVILARWLAANPEVLLLNDPTRGIDINAKRDLYRVISELAAEGMCIVMLSSEVDEHLDLMDRVIVFRENAIAAEISHSELDRERLVSAYFGQQEEAS
ncbi:sugar ABC transporter ATP-binding protein [Microbacterium sp. A196]|uniref:sugar ABC transporter ATP-binding protein n=1 Tax=unclassified Microbacterium TaxID=2609290 RepID=UPI003FCF1618